MGAGRHAHSNDTHVGELALVEGDHVDGHVGRYGGGGGVQRISAGGNAIAENDDARRRVCWYLSEGTAYGASQIGGVAAELDISPLLACLFLGITQTNLLPDREKIVDRVFRDFEAAIMAVFFTLAGMHLDFDNVALAGVAAIVFFVLRSAGKLLSVEVSMRWSGAPDALRKNLGMALLPQAGLAIGLVLLIRDDRRWRRARAPSRSSSPSS